MERHALRDDQFARIEHLLPGRPGTVGRNSELGNRLFVDAVIWKFRVGTPWRDLPERFGGWCNTHERFSRWAVSGVWESLFKALADDPDNEYAMIDATIVRAHQHSAGALKKGVSTKPSAARAVGSPKLSCARRISITALLPAPCHGFLRTQQIVVDLADRLDRLLQFLIIEPTANLGNPFATHTDLPGASAGVAHRQNENPVPFATRAFRAIFWYVGPCAPAVSHAVFRQ
jgi:transposase